MTRLVGLDVGTSSVKGLAIDQHGAVLAVAERGYPLSTPRPGWAEQDPELWWEAASAVLDEIDGAAALAIGLSGQMHGLVALDAKERPVRPAILWNDGRTQAQCEEI
jgi:xylulokinase